MSTLSIRIPDSLHKRARARAKSEHVSINQLLATALAEKIAVLDAETCIWERAARGSRTKFLNAMAWVPDLPPTAHDLLTSDIPYPEGPGALTAVHYEAAVARPPKAKKRAKKT